MSSFICEKNYFCCEFQYWDDWMDVDEDSKLCGHLIEVAPVVHAHWIDRPSGRYGQRQSWCSNCDKPSGIGGIESNRHKQYCPNCGAKMDGEDNETN